jgi:hypothetical protein
MRRRDVTVDDDVVGQEGKFHDLRFTVEDLRDARLTALPGEEAEPAVLEMTDTDRRSPAEARRGERIVSAAVPVPIALDRRPGRPENLQRAAVPGQYSGLPT